MVDVSSEATLPVSTKLGTSTRDAPDCAFSEDKNVLFLTTRETKLYTLSHYTFVMKNRVICHELKRVAHGRKTFKGNETKILKRNIS